MQDALLAAFVPLVLSGVVFFEDRIKPPALRRGVQIAIPITFAWWLVRLL